ncbi:hypothetical protein [Actinomadura xylanilytica]|uniref:hypothetical protein n=1 Tax=Actinomadura xylanilytica TaxID=887459 RepID=UPI00255AAEA8|nr:hypothetical protein [Actinomadura xylanilytica]MDL4773977.1 hypothetical protein [Actinomadura xylanilytica]
MNEPLAHWSVHVSTPPPSPQEAASWAEFTARLRELYDWCGAPKYRALCGRNAGLSPAAISTLIGKNPLTRPPETATARFVSACLGYQEWPDAESEMARWRAHWKHLNEPRPVPPATAAAPPAPAPAPVVNAPSGASHDVSSDASRDASSGGTPSGTATRAPSAEAHDNDASDTEYADDSDTTPQHTSSATTTVSEPSVSPTPPAPPASSAPFDGRARRLALLTIAIVTAAVTAAVVAFLVVPGGDRSDPATSCQFIRGNVADSRTKRTWPHLYQCPNRPNADVYAEPRADAMRIGVLKTDPSWFICWTHGRPHSGGNDIWYYTQGDTETARPDLNSWGYVPAYELHVGRHPDSRVARECGQL